jgi:hypothetical protein
VFPAAIPGEIHNGHSQHHLKETSSNLNLFPIISTLKASLTHWADFHFLSFKVQSLSKSSPIIQSAFFSSILLIVIWLGISDLNLNIGVF